MKKKKIVVGVCGIGRGHSQRQYPVITELGKENDVIIFAFRDSYAFYKDKFSGNKNIALIEVVVPRYADGPEGIDYRITAASTLNDTSGYFKINMLAMQAVKDKFGRPDLVISDYEPISAQLAYSMHTPLLTLDQQSKYLFDDFPPLNNMTVNAEQSRLNLFFPHAEKRIATSFFKLSNHSDKIVVMPPIIRDSVVAMRKHNRRQESKKILVYMTFDDKSVQATAEIVAILSSFREYEFFLFTSPLSDFDPTHSYASNIHVYHYGSPVFEQTMRTMDAAISTGGHTFLSESTYLERPVYAMPLGTYEQAYNAYVIEKSGFGMSREKITKDDLAVFLENIPRYRQNIIKDKDVLFKTTGQSQVLEQIYKMLF